MKGVNKRVIEISQPDEELIEKILVFIKPGVGDVSIKAKRDCAESIVAGMRIEKKTYGRFIAGALILLSAVLALLLCFFVFMQ